MRYLLTTMGGSVLAMVLSVVLTLIFDAVLDAQFYCGLAGSAFPTAEAHAVACRRFARRMKRQTFCFALLTVFTVTGVIAYLYGGDSGITMFAMFFSTLSSILLVSI